MKVDQVTAAARLEYDQHRDLFVGMGVSVDAYVLSRLADHGIPSTSTPRLSYSHLGGLVSIAPQGNQVGA